MFLTIGLTLYAHALAAIVSGSGGVTYLGNYPGAPGDGTYLGNYVGG
jgi:hypothetical protein